MHTHNTPLSLRAVLVSLPIPFNPAVTQAALERSQACESTLTARLTELNSQLATSSVEGGSLRAHNGELLAELAALRYGGEGCEREREYVNCVGQELRQNR